MTSSIQGEAPARSARPKPRLGLLARLREYGRLARLEGGGFAVVALFGAFAAGGAALETPKIVGLFIVNLLFLLGGCLHNDLADAAVDRQAEKLKDRPLVRGTISRPQAAWATVACFLGCLLLAWCLAPSVVVVSVLAASIALALLYNSFSKRIFGADMFFAVSAALLCVYGGMTAVSDGGMLHALGGTLWAVAAVILIDHFFFNAVEGGLKDFESDARVGAPTIARCGFRVSQGALRLAPGAKAFFLALKAASVLLVFLPFVAFGCPSWTCQLVALGVASALTLLFTWKILGVGALDRQRIGRLTRMQEMACRALVPLLLARVAGVGWMAALILVPFAWFLIFNYILHGNVISNPKTG